MAGIIELIKVDDNGIISFGNHLLEEKAKKDDFEVDGDIYKIKTFKTMTKLEKNGRLLYESVPGTTVHNVKLEEKKLSCTIEGDEDAQITIELVPEQEYKIFIDGIQVGKMKSNLAGKLNLSVDFARGSQDVIIQRV